MKILISVTLVLLSAFTAFASGNDSLFVGKTLNGLACGIKIETCQDGLNTIYATSVLDLENSDWDTKPLQTFLSSKKAHLNGGLTSVANTQVSQNNILNYVYEKSGDRTFHGHSSLIIKREGSEIVSISLNKEGTENIVTGSRFYGTYKHYRMKATENQKCLNMQQTEVADRRLLLEGSLCSNISSETSVSSAQMERINASAASIK